MLALFVFLVGVWVAIERQTIGTLVLGLFWFLGMVIALCLLAIFLGVMWCFDTGLGLLVNWLGEHCEELE